jgi:hypothetical protein
VYAQSLRDEYSSHSAMQAHGEVAHTAPAIPTGMGSRSGSSGSSYKWKPEGVAVQTAIGKGGMKSRRVIMIVSCMVFFYWVNPNAGCQTKANGSESI